MDKSYAYFTLFGENIDVDVISTQLNIEPSRIQRKGDIKKTWWIASYWARELHTEHWKEYYDMRILIKEIVDKLYSKITIINDLKSKFHLESRIYTIMCIDENYLVWTPSIWHTLKITDFLYQTQTITGTDIYLFNSEKRKLKKTGPARLELATRSFGDSRSTPELRTCITPWV